MWDRFGNTVNNAFFFVIDKIVDLQKYFTDIALGTGRIVFLIAILTAALNYALTGTGLKENLIKIFKATVFFLIVIAYYPQIIGSIASMTFEMAEKSIYLSVKTHFDNVTQEIEVPTAPTGNYGQAGEGGRRRAYKELIKTLNNDQQSLFPDLTVKRGSSGMNYTVVAPASVLKIVFMIADECIGFADDKKNNLFPEFSRVLKGLICAFFAICTGVFALLEYLICFLEFMLVASVGIILFPLSIWEGSKFLSEKFIGAIVGFFIKMLFCNIAIFLMLYGYISIFYIINNTGFTGTVDQILFIVFSSLLFFYICKSAPGIAQSLLTGTPSLSATGAISAAAGAVGAAGAVMGVAQKATGKIAGGATKAIVGGGGSLIEANAASNAAKDAVKAEGGNEKTQAREGRKAFWNSIGNDVGDSFKAGGHTLMRSLLGANGGGSGGSTGGGTNPHSWRQDLINRPGENGNQTFGEHFAARKKEGVARGQKNAEKHGWKDPSAPTHFA